MKTRLISVAVVLVGVVGLMTGRTFSQEQDKKSDKGGPDPAMMEAWKKAVAPGSFHAHLKPLEGRWNFATKWRMASEQPWEQSKGAAEYKWILGGRFLQQNLRGEVHEGERYEGMGISGYDNGLKKYTSIWTDNMSTGVMISTGTCDASGKVFTYTGTVTDPFTGQPKKEKSVLRIINDDKHVFEMFSIGPDGKEFQSLVVTYTRS